MLQIILTANKTLQIIHIEQNMLHNILTANKLPLRNIEMFQNILTASKMLQTILSANKMPLSRSSTSI